MPAEFTEGSKLEVATKLTRKVPVSALNAIGAYLVSQSQAAFRSQSFNGERWQERLVPNVPGIVRDLNRGGVPAARRFQARPALVDTGTLRKSINFSAQPNAVVVGSTLAYAAVHHRGGTTEPVELTAQGRKALARFLRTRPAMQESLGHLFNKPKVVRNVPARPFVGLQQGDAEEIEAILREEINNA